VGNQTQGVYQTTDGKWFNSVRGGSRSKGLPVNDASNGPDDQPLAFDSATGAFVNNFDNLGPYEKICTGKNQSTFSTAFYRTAEAIQNDQPVLDGAPCFQQGAVPLTIQNLTSWEQNGCNEGFLCTTPATSLGCFRRLI